MADKENFNVDLQDEEAEDFVVDFGEVTRTGGGGGTSNFNELTNRPKYNNQTMTGSTNIPKVPAKTSELENDSGYQNGTQVENAIETAIGQIEIPTKTSDLDNDGEDGTSTYVEADDLAKVATTGDYDDLIDKPTIPTVNNATLTITQNGTSKGTFTANDADDTTIEVSDTTYSNFTGTDGVSAGTAGLVPAPATTDAGKFLKADGTWDTAGGGSAVKVLTSADYNYPVNNPSYIALGYLDDGFYTWSSSIQSNVYLGDNNMSTVKPAGRWAYVITTNAGASPVLKYIFSGNLGSSDSSGDKTFDLYFFRADNGNADVYRHFLSSENIIDNLTSSDTVYPLSAKQGKALKDTIDGLLISGAGAPTTSTVGTIGQLYEDTTNGKLYQCTAVSGSTYTWSEVGAGGGGGGDIVYSTKTTSNASDGGAVYIGGKNASQTIYQDPTTTDNHYKYFWALPFNTSESANTRIPGNETVNIGGDQLPGGDDNVTVGYRTACTGSHNVNIGFQAGHSSANGSCVCVGDSAKCQQNYGVALGRDAMVNQTHTGSVALGYNARTTRQGEVYIGTNSTFAGYNSTKLRVIGGVHDGQLADDAVTVGQLNATIDAINTALSTNIPHVGA